MRTRFLRGNTQENNGLTLPEGELAIDLEKMALRLHVGDVLGGYEIVGSQAYVPPVGPGPTTLLAGDDQLGWYGEVSGAELITYSGLSSAVGMSAGTLQHDAESVWLKFAYQGEILFVAKKPIRHSISWDHINAVNAVYDNVSAPTIQVGSDTLRVTLLTGGDADPASGPGGEWNDLIYRVHTIDPTGMGWEFYSNTDLNINSGYGYRTWVQESYLGYPSNAVYRGENLEDFSAGNKTLNNSANGWRPVLRLQA